MHKRKTKLFYIDYIYQHVVCKNIKPIAAIRFYYCGDQIYIFSENVNLTAKEYVRQQILLQER